ncbi:hypothetical protein ACTTAL_09525 [Rhodobacter capsulatus]
MLMLTAVNVRRLLSIGREAGVMLTLVASFLISLIVVLGFVFRIEFAQAVALILVPLSGVGVEPGTARARLEPVLADAPEVEGRPDPIAASGVGAGDRDGLDLCHRALGCSRTCSSAARLRP